MLKEHAAAEVPLQHSLPSYT